MNVATPVALSVPVPKEVEPSMNVTVPVGTVVPEAGVTVAVNVTDCPACDGLSEVVSVVVVAVSPVGTRYMILDKLLVELLSPTYFACTC